MSQIILGVLASSTLIALFIIAYVTRDSTEKRNCSNCIYCQGDCFCSLHEAHVNPKYSCSYNCSPWEEL